MNARERRKYEKEQREEAEQLDAIGAMEARREQEAEEQRLSKLEGGFIEVDLGFRVHEIFQDSYGVHHALIPK